jgi:hypothetical protein
MLPGNPKKAAALFMKIIFLALGTEAALILSMPADLLSSSIHMSSMAFAA